MPPSATLGVAVRLTVVVSIVSVIASSPARRRPTRFSKLPPVALRDRGRHAAGVDVRRRRSAPPRCTLPLLAPAAMVIVAAVVERDRDGAACAAAASATRCRRSVPPSATLGVAVRLTVVVSIVSVIGRRRRRGVDHQVLEVAAGRRW